LPLSTITSGKVADVTPAANHQREDREEGALSTSYSRNTTGCPAYSSASWSTTGPAVRQIPQVSRMNASKTTSRLCVAVCVPVWASAGAGQKQGAARRQHPHQEDKHPSIVLHGFLLI
jgi:hypothetical protein